MEDYKATEDYVPLPSPPSESLHPSTQESDVSEHDSPTKIAIQARFVSIANEDRISYNFINFI